MMRLGLTMGPEEKTAEEWALEVAALRAEIDELRALIATRSGVAP